MCLILFSWKSHPKHDLILAANRDEFYSRPTRALSFWEDHPNIIAGRDLTAGGTWIGMNKEGKVAAITNFRDLSNLKKDAPSRGDLVSDFLKGTLSPKKYLDSISSTGYAYNGFNLIVGDASTLWYFNNVNDEIRELEPGTYGLSNGLINDPWPKVTKGVSSLNHLIKDDIVREADLIKVLEDTAPGKDNDLPKTGIPFEMEQALSPMFIEIPDYGTRCSTVILTGRNKTVFSEKTHGVGNDTEQKVSFEI